MVKKLLILFVVLSLVLLAVVGYLLFSIRNREAQKAQEKPAVTSVPEKKRPYTGKMEYAANGKTIWFINAIWQKDGKYYVTLDSAMWLDGKDGVTACVKAKECEASCAGKDDCLPNGYYIQNESKEAATTEIAPTALVVVYDRMPDPVEVSLATFIKVFNSNDEGASLDEEGLLSLRGMPYHITIEKGKVTKIIQQYRP